MRFVKVTFFLLAIACLGSQTVRADWSKLNLNSFGWYKDITFVTKDRGWIVGTDGVILSTDDGGKTWQPNKRFTTDALLQIHFTDESTGWMLCERNVYARGDNPISYLRKTTNGGVTWEKVEFTGIKRERVTRMLFAADGRAMAFGEGGIFYRLQPDGVTWKKSTTAIHFVLLDGAFSDGSMGAIVGAGGTIIFTEDGGLTWERTTLIGNTDTKLNAISFGGPKGGWAVGNGGSIFRSNSGARLWRQQPKLTDANLNDIFFSDASHGWIVGDNGVILCTRDGGNSWIDMTTRVTHKLEKVIFHDSKGFAIGHGGTILTYDASNAPNASPGARPTLLKRS
jgi:photosystem II stability/assembly factor-like uncharacterized protein